MGRPPSFLLFGANRPSRAEQEEIMSDPSANGRHTMRARLYKIGLVCVWAGVVAFCVANRERFTVDGVVEAGPQNRLFAAVFMMFLFALKSMSVFLFSGILFAANGILFPLPLAVALNALGAGIMVSLPYWLGKKLGNSMAEHILQKYPKVEMLREMRTGHEFFFSLIARIIGILPSDILSLYMGAIGVSYPKYLAGSLLGMLFTLITFPVMGMSITDPASPVFLISLAVQTIVTGASLIGCMLCLRKKMREKKAGEGPGGAPAD